MQNGKFMEMEMLSDTWKIFFAGVAMLALCGCVETLQVQVLSNNNLLATRCQTATALTNAVASGSATGGGTTDASIPLPGLSEEGQP